LLADLEDPHGDGVDVKSGVLILDDHPSYLRVLRSAAETRGFKVIGTESTTGAALRFCSRARPDVIVVDLHLDSDSDGYAFCKLLREVNGPVKIVVTSAFTGRDTVQRAFHAGADRCLRKPFRMEEALRMFEHLALELAPIEG
jgi:DNA-binding NarL/FixJ family response regulator